MGSFCERPHRHMSAVLLIQNPRNQRAKAKQWTSLCGFGGVARSFGRLMVQFVIVLLVDDQAPADFPLLWPWPVLPYGKDLGWLWCAQWRPCYTRDFSSNLQRNTVVLQVAQELTASVCVVRPHLHALALISQRRVLRSERSSRERNLFFGISIVSGNVLGKLTKHLYG